MAGTKLKEYELINPSDPYTFLAPNLEVAALVALILGEGRYGAKDQEGKESVPIFLFGGVDEWFQDTFGKGLDTCFRDADRKVLADALNSLMLGTFSDRRKYEMALAAITDSRKREQFIRDWQDECTSLNDIGTRAHQMAKKFLATPDKDGDN